MLLANNIYFNRNKTTILQNVNLKIASNEIIHLAGNNGSGKTTLLKIITNILEPQQGEIFWNGKNIKKNPFIFYNNFTFIMDKHTSNTNLTLMENIYYWKKLFSSKITMNEINSLLKTLTLAKYRDIQICYLSFGEIKKLELLRLVIEQKKLWILDEPLIGLDSNSVEIINYTITNHLKLGGMVIFTSHIPFEIENMIKITLEKYD